MIKSKDKFRKALYEDFRTLYVPGFTTTWKEERMVRELEIDIMLFDHVRDYIRQVSDKAYEDGYKDCGKHWDDIDSDLTGPIYDKGFKCGWKAAMEQENPPEPGPGHP